MYTIANMAFPENTDSHPPPPHTTSKMKFVTKRVSTYAGSDFADLIMVMAFYMFNNPAT